MKKYFIILLLILLVPIVSANQGHLTLLTVSEINSTDYVGGTADLFLEIKQGSGRVFIDSFPLTKVDTQISTRFAKEVACDFLELDCSNKDFFYTIRAESPIVGGPSAGSAITLLTISLLDGSPLDKNTVITGTINSGGLIGPVSGIEQKAEAAREKGFTKVLVPKWSIVPNESQNESNFNITYAESLKVEGIEIKTISTLEEALSEFTSKTYDLQLEDIEIPEKYQEIMGDVANTLCKRYDEIIDKISDELKITGNSTLNITNESMQKAKEALESEDYYSAASYCFTSNTRIRTLQFSNLTNASLENIKRDIESRIGPMLEKINNQELKTMSDLETHIIVKERIYETLELLERNDSLENLGYIYERLYSAVAWSVFFEYDENPVVLDEQYLKNACLSKIAEAEERQSYVELLFGVDLSENNEIKEVREKYEEGDYAFCLFKASKIKADSGAILSTTGLTFEKVPELIDDQLKLAQNEINKQGEKFPILGYSYYNYAASLKNDNPTLATLFSGYSIELSNLDMYFPKEKSYNVDLTNILSFQFVLGFTLGVAVSIFAILYRSKK